MMRFKLVALIVIVFGAVGSAVYVSVSESSTRQAEQNIDARLLAARQSVLQRRTLHLIS